VAPTAWSNVPKSAAETDEKDGSPGSASANAVTLRAWETGTIRVAAAASGPFPMSLCGLDPPKPAESGIQRPARDVSVELGATWTSALRTREESRP